MDSLDTIIFYAVMNGALLAVLLAVRAAFDPTVKMSRISRKARLFAGPLWAAAIVLGMIFRIWEQAAQR
jgi:hypothetical protein